jgi:transcription initiation factor IIE alpha subunit
MVVTRCNYAYVNLLSLVEDLEDCKIIKLLERYLYETTAHNFYACPNGKPQMKYA